MGIFFRSIVFPYGAKIDLRSDPIEYLYAAPQNKQIRKIFVLPLHGSAIECLPDARKWR
jgi:hypothetical protein